MASSGGQEVSYGGQAVIEGVMIRSPRYVSVACRLPDEQGKAGVDTPIDVHTEKVTSLFARRPFLRKIPFLRGFLALFEMLGIGLRSLERSANIQAAFVSLLAPLLTLAQVEGPAEGGGETEHFGGSGKGQLNGPLMWGTIATSFALGAGLFILLPNWLAELIGRWAGFGDHSLGLNLVEGAIRFIFFIGYVGLIGLMPDIRRVFQYHGAEHKVVNGFEAGVPRTVDAVREMSVIHPRCGTNFAFLVIVISLIVFSFLPWVDSLLVRVGYRLLLLPVVAGIGFEIIKLVGTYRHVGWLQALIYPGLAMQKLTTREPAPDMIEVALASFNAVKLAEETDELTRTVQRPEPVPFPAVEAPA